MRVLALFPSWGPGCLCYWFGQLCVYLWSGMSKDCKPENFASLFNLKRWCRSVWYCHGVGTTIYGRGKGIGWLWDSHLVVPMPSSLLLLTERGILWIIIYVCLYLHSVVHISFVFFFLQLFVIYVLMIRWRAINLRREIISFDRFAEMRL